MCLEVLPEESSGTGQEKKIANNWGKERKKTMEGTMKHRSNLAGYVPTSMRYVTIL